MSPRELLKKYWQVPSALLIAGVAVALSHSPEPLPQVIPEPTPDLVDAVVVTAPMAAGDVLNPAQLTQTQYPLAWMPQDALRADSPELLNAPLVVRPLAVGTPLAANMLMPNPMAGLEAALDDSKLFMPVPPELSRMLPKQLPPEARVALVYESKVGTHGGVVLTRIPVTRSGEGAVTEVTWFVMDEDELAILQRALRLGRLRLALCRDTHCPSVTLTRIPEQQQTKAPEKTRATVTVGLS